MKYVYLLQSIDHPDETYVGLTSDLKARLAAHNAGQSCCAASAGKPAGAEQLRRLPDEARSAKAGCR